MARWVNTFVTRVRAVRQPPSKTVWLVDLVVLRYAIRINGLTEICLTKLDVLDGLKPLKFVQDTTLTKDALTSFHWIPVYASAKPIYDEVPGWDEDISQITDFEQLPLNAKNYVKYISNLAGVPISMISVGSKRSQTIHLLER